MKAMILYEHCSPHQVIAVEAARAAFTEAGHTLVPAELYSGSLDYGWTFADMARPPEWICFFPGHQQISNWQRFRETLKQIKQQKIDVLVVNGWYSKFVWWLRAIKSTLRCKLVIVSDSVQWDHPRSALKEKVKSWLVRGMDAGFVAGQPQREYLHALGMPLNRMALGNDVVNNALYSSVPAPIAQSNRPLIIGTAARLIPKKNLAVAMQSLSVVQQSQRELNIEWRIAGRGPLEVELKQHAEDLRAPVVFQGFVGYHDMPGFYGGIDLYWQPSLSEPWGLVINEAMASGRPVLVSDRCGCALDLVTSETGWIHGVSSESMVAGLRDAIRQHVCWPSMGDAARRWIDQWGPSRFADGLLESCRIACGVER
jgi:glycosyltransferase involved in cell wall biosynthesis